MKKLLLFAIVSVVLFSCNEEKKNVKHPINIIPKPVKINLAKGEFVVNKNTKVNISIENNELRLIASDFAELLKIIKHSDLKIQTVKKVDDLDNEIRFCLVNDNLKYGNEGYSIDVTEKGVLMTAHKPAGLFYAVQTIKQIMPYQVYNLDSIKNIDLSIPYLNIFDKPRFSWRGNMLDPSRHFISVDFIKKNLDYLASLKMNIFHWHLTDDQGWRIEIKSLPKLTELGAWRVDRNDEEWWGRKPQLPGEKADYGGFYSQEEIKDIIQYANKRYITIIPEIDMPGHSQAAIASYPEISCDGRVYYVATGGVATDNTYCPGKEATFEFTEKVLNEVMELFPSEYVHIGGDECNKEAWKICPDCQKRIRIENLNDEQELQSYFIRRIEKTINSKAKKMIGWDEILEGGLAPNATLMSWRGETGGITALKAGHEVVMTPNQYCYLDLKQGDAELEPNYGYSQLLLSTVYSYNPIPQELSEEEANLILGIQGNLWGESMQNDYDLNYMLFPRLFAIAEVAWSPQELRNFKEFIPRMEYALKRLDVQGINYANSAYNVSVFMDINKNTNKLMVKLRSEIKNDIRYTTDGSEPDINSELYQNPFEISETTIIKARSFINNKASKKLTVKTIKLHKAAGKKVELSTLVSEKYNSGDYALTDCIRGGMDFTNNRWMGFEGKDFEAIIDLGEKTIINSITASFLHDTKSWIFIPEEIEIAISEDGSLFESIKIINNTEEAHSNGKFLKEFNVKVKNITTRYIKVKAKSIGVCPDWHRGAGGKAWIFIDEIIVD